MAVILCKDCEYFAANMNKKSALTAADFHCGNTCGMISPGPNDYCSRAVPGKRQQTDKYDEAVLAKIYQQRRG